MTARVFLLKCAVQTYAWGKLGPDSEVAKLSECGNEDFTVDEDTPYAELWMGTHPKGPSEIENSGSQSSLAKWVEENPDCLGSKIREKFNGQLPFLFKVLSVNKSLSIQAHPNKRHAEELHQAKPDKYPDNNHKPEMAIALTPFEGMCGFRPIQEIAAFMKSIPELCSVVGDTAARELIDAQEVVDDQHEKRCRRALKTCFTALMTCQDVETHLKPLVERVQKMVSAGQDTSSLQGELLLRLNSQFPGDVGCFCIYFLNILRLQPGEAMFLEANLPHAYLAGDCMECMACSDNVVRAGLTPKFKDVPTLCEMLNYQAKSAKENLFPSVKDTSDEYSTMYNPPIPDFAVTKVQLPKNTKYTLPSLDSASIVLVISGEGTGKNKTMQDGGLSLGRGSVLFISAGESVDVSVGDSSDMLMFRAYADPV